MASDAFGQLCALLAALTWASALVLFKRSGEHIPALALNLFKNTIGIILLVATLSLTGGFIEVFHLLEPIDIGILMISGILGIALADTAMLYSLNLIGVGLIAIVDCSYSPLVILCSWILLSEQLTVFHYIGGGLIVAGVFVSSHHTPPADRTRGQIIAGILIGILAIALMAFGIVLAKPVLEFTPIIPATLLRLLPGTIVLALFAVVSPQRKLHFSAFRPAPVWKFSVPASVLGTYVAMIFWIGGFKYTSTSVAAILNQTSTVFAIVLATFVLKEAMDNRKKVAALLAVTGVFIVRAAPFIEGLFAGGR
jgi:drug/metabolite transporter (DMT)-like permease